jgi:hypothetical protein
MSEEDPKQALDNLSKKTAILLALCASGRGRAAAICAFVILLCARIFWSLRRHVLFWVALMIVALLHIPLILRIEWGNRNYPGVALLPLAFLMSLRGQGNLLYAAGRGGAGGARGGLLPLCRMQPLVGARADRAGGDLQILRYGFCGRGWRGRRKIRELLKIWPRPSSRSGL